MSLWLPRFCPFSGALALVSLLLLGVWIEPSRAAVPAAPCVPDEHTLILLHFDEMQGQVVKDASGRDNDAIFDAAPNAPQWFKSGRFGGCLAFDGMNEDQGGDGKGDADGILLKKGGAPNPEGSGFTVDLWVRHANLKGTQYYITRVGEAGRYVFGCMEGGPYVAFLPGKSDWVRARAPGTLKAGVWQHVAFTYDKAFLRVYVDGVEKAKTSAVGEIAAGVQESVIGRDTDERPDSIRGFCGLIDEMRISDIARTDFPQGPYETKDPLPTVSVTPAATTPPAKAGEIDLSGVQVDRGGAPEAGQTITARGTVFLDANDNGRKDPDEKGLPGVCVSNGDDVVKTDDAGGYTFSFKVDAPRDVFLTVPSGYRATAPFYRRIALTDSNKYEYDFGLVQDAPSGQTDFSFVAGGDIQYLTAFKENYAQLSEDFGQMAALGRSAAFAVFPGDLTSEGRLADLMILKKVVGEVWRKPFHTAFGGHDALNSSGVGNFMDVLGPMYYSWDYGNSHFIALASENAYMKGPASARQGAWLQKDLALQPKEKPIYVICHTPEEIAPTLSQLAAQHTLRAVIRGHYHINNTYEGPGGVPVMTSAPYRSLDWGVFTRKCRIISVQGAALSSRMRVLGQVKRLVITAPMAGDTVAAGDLFVQANAYDTALDVSAVDYEITAPDGTKTAGKLQRCSDWSWSAVCKGLKAQAADYSLKLTARSESGEAWAADARFRCSADKGKTLEPVDDWPSIFGGGSGMRSRSRPLAPPLHLAWVGCTGGVIYYLSSPIVVGGKVVVGVADGEVNAPRAGVAAFEARTGRLIWKTPTGADIHSSVASLSDKVYALDTNSKLSCLDLNSGRVAWEQRVQPARFGWTMCMGPVAASAGRVFVAPDLSSLTCLDADTGKALWNMASGPDDYYRTSVLFAAQQTGYVSGRAWYGAVDVGTGAVRWKKSVKSCRGASTPTPYGDVLYVPNQGLLRAVKPDSGEELWQAPLPGPLSQSPAMAVAYEGRVFTSRGGAVYALDATTGKTLWTVDTNQNDLFRGSKWQIVDECSTPLVAGNYVYVGSDNGTFYAIDASAGKVAWSYYVGVPIKSSPAMSGNMVFISAFDGNIYAFVGETP